MFTLKTQRTVQAPADVVWDVISDVERYAEYAPNLSHAEKTSAGLTPARRCYDTRGRGWNEACVLWEEGKQYSYVIDTSDYPYPFIQMKGTWGMDHTPDVPFFFKYLVHWRVRMIFTPIVEKLMDNWESEIKQRT